MGKASAVLSGEREPSQQFQGVFDAVVTRSTADEVWFTIPDFSPELELGPARYPLSVPSQTEAGGSPSHSHNIDAGQPAAGTDLLIAFVGGDPDKPRVLHFLGWPS